MRFSGNTSQLLAKSGVFSEKLTLYLILLGNVHFYIDLDKKNKGDNKNGWFRKFKMEFLLEKDSS